MKGSTPRARLLALLAEACELEHALCCSYLYAGFSLKRDISEGLDWQQQQTARLWAARIYHIAAQEMLHLAQAWNIMIACGGAPYYARPEFPQPAKHFPLNIALSLRRFDAATLDRFIVYERPEDEPLLESPLSSGELWPIDEDFEYDSVGELYGEIARLIETSEEAELFVGKSTDQADQELVDFYDIVHVSHRASALAAIERITEQGEGNAGMREDSHYGVFVDMREEFDDSGLDLALPVADNPFLKRSAQQLLVSHAPEFETRGPKVTPITAVPATHAIDLFNEVYVVMLQALAHVFSGSGSEHALRLRISRIALELMITVIKPLGEAICRLPSGQDNLNAGPSFEIHRHVAFPADTATASSVFDQRLRELSERGVKLADTEIPDAARSQIVSAAGNLRRLAESLQQEISE